MKSLFKNGLEAQKEKGTKVQNTITTKQAVVSILLIGGISYLSGSTKGYKAGYIDGVNTLGGRIVSMLSKQ